MFEECLYFNAAALVRVLEKKWGEAFQESDLSPAQGFMLRMILNLGSASPNELAQKLGISKATSTRLLDGLEQKKLVQRVPSEQDGRQFVVVPLKKAAPIKARLDEESAKVTRRIKESVGPDVFSETVSKLKSIRRSLCPS